MSLYEKISSAQGSKDLQETPAEMVGDVDVIRACGMVGVQMPLALSLWRLKYSAAHKEYPTVFDGLLTIMLSRFHREDCYRITQMVIKHWLDDVCKPCSGRGMETVPGTPMLSDKECEHCKGKGRIAMPEHSDAALWLSDEIARMEREIAKAISQKLNSRFDP